MRYVKVSVFLEEKDIVIGQKMLQQNSAYRVIQTEISKMMADKEKMVQKLID